MLFEGQKLGQSSGAPKLQSTGSSLFAGQSLTKVPSSGGGMLVSDYEDAIKKYDAGKLSASKLYNALNKAKQSGLIDTQQQQKIIKSVGSNEQAKIQKGFQKSVTPLEKVSQFAVENVVKPVASQLENVITAPIKYSQSVNRQQTQEAVNRVATASINKINQDATSGKISWDEAKKRSNAIMAEVNKMATKANKATKAFSDIDRTKLAADAAMTFLDIATLGTGGAALKTARGAASIGTKQVAQKLVGNVAEGAIYGGATGGLSAYSQGGPKTKLEDVLKSAALGAAIGGAVPVAAVGVGRVAKQIGKVTQKSKLSEAIAKTTPTKLRTPIDEVTSNKMDNLLAKDEATPVPKGHTRLYQTNDKGVGKSPNYFKDPDQLADYVNQRADNAELSFVDVPNKAVKQVPGKPTVFEVAKGTTPQVTKTPVKVSGPASKLQGTVEKDLVDTLPEPASYKGVSYKEEVSKAVDMVDNNQDEALKIAMGTKSGANVAQEQAVLKALSRKAEQEGDWEKVMQLSSSPKYTELSEAAQKLGVTGYGERKTAADILSEIKNVKVKVAEGRMKAKLSKTLTKGTKDITNNIKIPDKYDWDNFVESLRCK